MTTTNTTNTTKTTKRPRRGHGEGSVYQRADGRWTTELHLGVDKEGKRQKRQYYGKTRKEALDKMKAAQLELQQNGKIMDHTRMTLGDYLDQWLEQVKPTRRHSSFRIYDTAVRLHIVPEIGNVQLAKLTTLHIQRLYTAKSNEGYASNTIRNMHTALNLALRQAVTWQVVPRNAAVGAVLPKASREEMKYLIPEQVQQFVASLSRSRNKFRVLFATAVLTGLRLGELSGLSWADVDLKVGTVTVNRNLTWDRTDKTFYIGEPKTSFSRRTVPLPASLVPLLRAHRKEQLELRLGQTEWLNEHDLVFTFEDGRPLHQSHTRRMLTKALQEASLPSIRFHDLRHTFATVHLVLGTHVKVVSYMLGHSSVKITLDLYSHVVPGLETMAADRLDGLVSEHIANAPRAQL